MFRSSQVVCWVFFKVFVIHSSEGSRQIALLKLISILLVRMICKFTALLYYYVAINTNTKDSH